MPPKRQKKDETLMTYIDEDSFVYLDEIEQYLPFFLKLSELNLETLREIYPEPSRHGYDDSLAEHLNKKMKSTYSNSPIVLFLWGLDPGNRDVMAHYFGVYRTEEVMKFGYFFEKVRQNIDYFLANRTLKLLSHAVPKDVAKVVVFFIDSFGRDNPVKAYMSLSDQEKDELIDLVNPLNT